MRVWTCPSPLQLGAASWVFLEVMEAVGGAALPRLACRSQQCQAPCLLPSSLLALCTPSSLPTQSSSGREGGREALAGQGASPSLYPIPLEG